MYAVFPAAALTSSPKFTFDENPHFIDMHNNMRSMLKTIQQTIYNKLSIIQINIMAFSEFFVDYSNIDSKKNNYVFVLHNNVCRIYRFHENIKKCFYKIIEIVFDELNTIFDTIISENDQSTHIDIQLYDVVYHEIEYINKKKKLLLDKGFVNVQIYSYDENKKEVSEFEVEHERNIMEEVEKCDVLFNFETGRFWYRGPDKKIEYDFFEADCFKFLVSVSNPKHNIKNYNIGICSNLFENYLLNEKFFQFCTSYNFNFAQFIRANNQKVNVDY